MNPNVRPTSLTLASKPAKTGVKIEVYHPKRGWENVTIRDDYDFQNGQAPRGKGYHVNVEAPSEKVAFCTSSPVHDEKYVGNLWDYISERASVDGDQEAAEWYMRAKRR